mmetsp:Transcript_19002/g.39069  ORF Transcript_19002/g.39069 Transcript_19002/m.39069 type:complete len:481 (-) Transcript_19002:195-1637(-)
MASSGLINTLPRSSCGKCVKILKELVSGLENDNDNSNNKNNNSSTPEPPPLTLLRAIARSSQQHPHHDQWGQELLRGRRRVRRQRQSPEIHDSRYNNNNNTLSPLPPLLKIEETKDGVKLTIPVETTAPEFMRRWTQLEQQQHQEEEEDDDLLDDTDLVPLATSARLRLDVDVNLEGNNTEQNNNNNNSSNQYNMTPSQQQQRQLFPGSAAGEGSSSLSTTNATTTASNNNNNTVRNPLTIELKCRRCETTGPEAGARAFLMGPDPLSIVLCHNRIDSEPKEVEEILTHELTHLYDVQTLKLDLADCETVAYSEVRAAREAECASELRGAAVAVGAASSTFRSTALNGNDNRNGNATATEDTNYSNSSSDWSSSLTGMQTAATNLKESFSEKVIRPYCVKSIALGATQNMFPTGGKACLNKVWETAYADHRPFSKQQSRTQSRTARNQASQTTPNEHDCEHGYKRRASGCSGTSHGTSSK